MACGDNMVYKSRFLTHSLFLLESISKSIQHGDLHAKFVIVSTLRVLHNSNKFDNKIGFQIPLTKGRSSFFLEPFEYGVFILYSVTITLCGSPSRIKRVSVCLFFLTRLCISNAIVTYYHKLLIQLEFRSRLYQSWQACVDIDAMPYSDTVISQTN